MRRIRDGAGNFSTRRGGPARRAMLAAMSFLWAAAIHLGVLALHVALPARRVAGYVRDARGEPLRYRLNGPLVLTVTVGLWAAAAAAGWIPWNLFYRERVAMAAGAAVLGVLVTLAVVLPAPRRGGLLADLYLGRLENPRAGGVDLKMFLYLAGAVLLELNLLSYAAHHVIAHGPSPGVLLHTALMTFFVIDYLIFEEVHLYTYDLFAERVGFKLGWGCLAFYPFFYAVGLWTTAALPDPGTPPLVLAGCALVFLAGWVLSRGANLQKFLFKTRPGARFLGVLAPEALDGRLLVNGFWGLARHVNYLGEILMAVGATLALGHPGELGPWLYPLYYLVLLLPRERADDRRCARKYGPLWDAYRRRVPRRIVPGIY
jgi:delta14-sterol reductase